MEKGPDDVPAELNEGIGEDPKAGILVTPKAGGLDVPKADIVEQKG